MKAIAQFILKLLRYIGIDVYRIYVRFLQWRKWYKAIPSDMYLRTDGLCLAFDAYNLTSFSQVGRDFADKIQRTSIPFEIFDTNLNLGNETYISLSEQNAYKNRVTTTIHQKSVLLFSAMPMYKTKHFTHLLHPVWEFESGFKESYPHAFERISIVLTFSDFCTQYFKSFIPRDVPVVKVRFPFPLFHKNDKSREQTRKEWGLETDDFVVFFNFSYGSCYERKNPEAAIDAFSKAFSTNRKAKFLLKTAHSSFAIDKVALLAKKVQGLNLGERIKIVDQHMPHVELLNLMAASNVYLSLHRGEGMGLGMLEAMSVGTPVICTNYGGNTDFCKADTAFLVDYLMTAVKTDLPLYRYVKEWAEPDINQAALFLRQIFEHPEIGRQKANAATEFINDYYSIDNFEKDVKTALAVLQASPK